MGTPESLDDELELDWLGSDRDDAPLVDPRVDLLRQLAAELIRASLSPVTETELGRRMRTTLDATGTDSSSRDVTAAYFDLEADSAFVKRDGAGRFFWSDGQPSPMRVVTGLRRSTELAEEIERLESSGGDGHQLAAGIFAEPLLTAGEECRLARRIQRGDLEAKRRLVSANTRLVWSISSRWRTAETPGLGADDLFQEGCLGLIRAAEKFRPELGYRFSTYATWWIKQSISRGHGDRSRTVRLPVHVVELVRKVRRAEREIEARGDDALSPDALELVAALANMTSAEVEHLRVVSQPVASLDEVPDLPDSTFDLDEIIDEASRGETVRLLLGHLTHRERRVIELRNGLGGEKPATLDEVGKVFSVTRERIRQIEKEALTKLSSLAASHALVGGDRVQPQGEREAQDIDAQLVTVVTTEKTARWRPARVRLPSVRR
jgi:RNA polymerase primary sigma factor